MKRLLVAAILACCAPGAQAQWEIRSAADTSPAPRYAAVENSDGYRLRVFKDQHGTAHGTFTLRPGFDVFAQGGCPTIRIDSQRPLNLSVDGNACEVKGSRADFVLGTISSGEIHSTVLFQLMNGNTMELRFQLKGVGYRETRFSLQHSKQTLAEIIGPDVAVAEGQ